MCPPFSGSGPGAEMRHGSPSHNKRGIAPRARYYMPKIGRFIQSDPIKFRSGDANFYAYTSSSPIGAVDPWGLVRQQSCYSPLENLSNAIRNSEPTMCESIDVEAEIDSDLIEVLGELAEVGAAGLSSGRIDPQTADDAFFILTHLLEFGERAKTVGADFTYGENQTTNYIAYQFENFLPSMMYSMDAASDAIQNAL